MPSDSTLLNHARSFKNLTKTEERELARRASLGDRAARDLLVESNMRLAFKLARAWEGCGLPQEDLVQEAMVGLSIAVGKFDPDKGRFTTYATRWINKCLWDSAYGTSDTIKRPSRLSRTVTAVRDYTRAHPTATIEEIAEAVKRPLPEVKEALDHAHVVASTSDEDFREVGSQVLEETESLLDLLPVAEREAISWKHGLYGTACSMGEVAERLTEDPLVPGEFTRSDVAQLCRQATRTLRAARARVDDVICQED